MMYHFPKASMLKNLTSNIYHQARQKYVLSNAYEPYYKVQFPICYSTVSENTESKVLDIQHDVNCISCGDKPTKDIILQDMLIYNDFIAEEEEESLFNEVEPYLKRMRYEYSHWDNAIHGYRETERSRWTQKNKHILQKVEDFAFPPGKPRMAYVHVLDLAKEGHIKAHIDSVRDLGDILVVLRGGQSANLFIRDVNHMPAACERSMSQHCIISSLLGSNGYYVNSVVFCGSIIAGLSLLSSSVMRLVNDADKTKYADVLLRQRSLYIMRNKARYEYSHEVFDQEKSLYNGQVVPRERRISIICRCDAVKT